MAVKAGDLRGLSIDELGQKSKEIRDQLFNARVRHATGQLEDTAQIPALRRAVARIETVMREKRAEVTG